MQQVIRWTKNCAIMIVMLIVSGPDSGAQADSKKAIVLTLVFPRPSICLGTEEIPVQLNLLNAGNLPLQVELNRFGSARSFFAIYDTSEKQVRLDTFQSFDDSLRRLESKMMMIAPRFAYMVKGTVELKGEFFAHSGFYELQLNYSGKVAVKGREPVSVDVVSNGAIFELTACDPHSEGSGNPQ